MKNISNLLERSNLTPREKFLLLVNNSVQKMKTGKDILTKADKEALENWKARTNEEVREWNQLNEGWRLSGRMDIEVEIYYKDAQVAYLCGLPIRLNFIMHPAHRRMELAIANLKRIKKVTIEEAMEITQKQKKIKLEEGLDFDTAVYQGAFECLDPEDQKQLKELYADIEYEHQYLDQEEIIANLYGGKKYLSDEAKDTLADLIAEQSYNTFAKEYQLFHYFACIPLMEISQHFLKNHEIKIAEGASTEGSNPEEEDNDVTKKTDDVTSAMQMYADGHGTTIKVLIREECRRLLDHDLLNDYLPLIASDQAGLLKRWFKTKVKMRKTLLAHVAAGELTLRNRTETETRMEELWSKNLYDHEFATAQRILENLHIEPKIKDELQEKKAFETFDGKLITGESLYTFMGNYKFVKDFKRQVDTYNPNLGIVYADNDPEQKGEHLDRELLICNVRPDGELAAFSPYGINTSIISGISNGMSFLEEYTKNGKTWMRFNDNNLEKGFLNREQDIKDGYARLLAIEAVMKKLSPIYETDMTEHVKERIDHIKGFIEGHNQAVRMAADSKDSIKKTFLREKKLLHFDNTWIIDIEAIKADRAIIEEHETKLKEIFPNT